MNRSDIDENAPYDVTWYYNEPNKSSPTPEQMDNTEIRKFIIDQLTKTFNKYVNYVYNSNYFFNNGIITIQYITPHKGNNFTHLILANHVDTFERWSCISFEDIVHYSDVRSSMRVIIEELLCMTEVTGLEYESDDSQYI